MPRIGIAIVTFNAIERIGDCLSSLRSSLGQFNPGEIEVAIWDNASSDQTVSFVQKNHPEYKIYSSKENFGFAGANNKLLEILKPKEYFVLLNDDTIVSAAWLLELVSAARANEAAMVVQSQLRLWPDKDLVNSWGNDIHFLGYGYAAGYKVPVAQAGSRLTGIREIAYASGAAMLIKTQVLEETTLFDGSFFMYHEDLDLGWRVRLLGYKSILAPNSIVYHKYQFKKSLAKLFYMERNRLIVILQNYHWATLICLLSALLAMETGVFLYSLFTGGWREKIKVYRLFGARRLWRDLLEKRREIQDKRRASDRVVTSIFSGRIVFQDIDNIILRYLVNPIFNIYWQLVRAIMFW